MKGQHYMLTQFNGGCIYGMFNFRLRTWILISSVGSTCKMSEVNHIITRSCVHQFEDCVNPIEVYEYLLVVSVSLGATWSLFTSDLKFMHTLLEFVTTYWKFVHTQKVISCRPALCQQGQKEQHDPFDKLVKLRPICSYLWNVAYLNNLSVL